jgi:hypothetical protein
MLGKWLRNKVGARDEDRAGYDGAFPFCRRLKSCEGMTGDWSALRSPTSRQVNRYKSQVPLCLVVALSRRLPEDAIADGP